MSKPYREQKPSLQQADRLPVATYEQAVNRLLCLWLDRRVSRDSYDGSLRMAADIFWTTEKTLHNAVMKANRQLGG